MARYATTRNIYSNIHTNQEVRQAQKSGDCLFNSTAGAAAVDLFVEEFPATRSWKQRAAYVYHSIPYSRKSAAAVRLALLALSDRSRFVRHRACMLLACSLDKTSLSKLRECTNHPDSRTRADVAAAIDAIECGNHNYFVDRDHSGMITLRFSSDVA
jgi:hypothetical protein